VTIADSSEMLLPGTQLGKYEIVHRIAFGGMAEIYLARSSGIHGFEKYVVLKRILPEHAANREFVRLFLKEARVAAALDHANVAHVYDIGEDRGIYFFTMEYLHGEDLRVIARELTRQEAKLPLEHALGIAIGAAGGLHFAHEKRSPSGESLGIVHRDVSPSNIVVTYDGGTKIVDFGIAKITADPDLSRRHDLKGKIPYMSPEQIRGGRIDRRSDVFSLGIVLFEMTTQERLFSGTSDAHAVSLVLDFRTPRPSERVRQYPVELERIVMRALEKDVRRRYQTARELLLDLEAFARDQKLQVSSAALAEWMERTFGRKQEPWNTSPPTPHNQDAEGSTTVSRRSPTVVLQETTRIVSPAALTSNQADFIADLIASPLTPVEPAESPTRPPSRRRVFVVAAMAVLILSMGSAALALRAGRGAPRVAAPAESRDPAGAPEAVTVEPSAVAVRSNQNLGASRSPGAPEGAAGAHASPGASRASSARRASTRVRSSRTSAREESFSATFSRREKDIRRCLATFSADARGASHISLRFQASKEGRVTAVSVEPASVGATPLGGCLARVAASTVFAPRAEPVTFRIPLTVELSAH
jgi:serine/threonine protein kinase